MDFDNVEIELDYQPIVLIDNSGSTGTRMQNNKNILQNEIEKISEKLTELGVEEVRLMFWDHKFTNFGTYPVSDLLKIKVASASSLKRERQINKNVIGPQGATYLDCVLEHLPKGWYQDKKVSDLYIVTDGELSGKIRRTSELLKELIEEFGIRIFIMTVESNGTNYSEGNISSGRAIYRMIRENGLMKNVKEFVSFNNYHKDIPFINFMNPDLPRGYIPFRKENFKLEKLPSFIGHIQKIIQSTKDNIDMIKLAHELSISIYNINKHKAEHLQFGTIEIFCRLFEGSKQYGEIREMFLKEIKNHMSGKSSTFTDYKRNREKVFEKAQMSLFESVKDTLKGKNKRSFVSFPARVGENDENKVIITFKPEEVKEPIKFYEKTFKMGGAKYQDYVIPVFPIDIFMDGGFGDQCMRQWIRMNYCKKYGFKIASDYILYYFLVDAVKVILSENINEETKNAYKTLMRIMLDRKKYGLDITEFSYLQNNNHPSSSNGNTKKITYLLNNAAKSEKINVKPYTLWYCISKIVGLEKSQLQFCTQDLFADGSNIVEKVKVQGSEQKEIGKENKEENENKKENENKEEEEKKKEKVNENEQEKEKENEEEKTKVVEVEEKSKDNIYKIIQSNYQQYNEINLIKNIQYEYVCYITLDDTSKTGGYTIPRHHITDTMVCRPNYVLSEEGLQSYQGRDFLCPICYTRIEKNSLIKIKSQKERLKDLETKENKIQIVNEPKYKKDSHEILKITTTDNDYELKLLDECNLKTLSYEFDKPVINDPLGNHRPLVFTQEEFNKSVYKRFPFLNGLNYDGICLAGGFCRSIILKSQMKDLDFFFYGENEDHYKNFLRFYKELIENIKEHESKNNNNISFLLMYKPQFNVFEMVGIVDPNNFISEEYSLDNFSNYKFTSLRRYNKFVYIDPTNKKVYRKKLSSRYKEREIEEDIEKFTKEGIEPWNNKIESKSTGNYFEDRDITGLRIKYRIQFILVKFNGIGDIFDSFDMHPSKVAFDGEHTYLTPDSEMAYRYMMNVIDEKRYSDLFDTRLNKYLCYGFSIVMPHLNIDLIKRYFNNRRYSNVVEMKINKFKFSVSDIDGNNIIINHNSNIKEKLDYIKELQENAKKEDIALYKSSMYCSLVSLLRYVKINKIPYLFCKDIKLPKENTEMIFKEEQIKITFQDKLNSRIHDFNWYGKYKKK
ncbi:a-type inclusion protein [Anaeramoeba flamelloides]|uniref:A-type inclusion protein n=1 Tax=Anaeramoeba flamelloides TaxID=1746091 RepID=A0ABQ8Z6D0_9EUKA|nr:a-type inclusion protein [Anaeramoeba flamelloides]